VSLDTDKYNTTVYDPETRKYCEVTRYSVRVDTESLNSSEFMDRMENRLEEICTEFGVFRKDITVWSGRYSMELSWDLPVSEEERLAAIERRRESYRTQRDHYAKMLEDLS